MQFSREEDYIIESVSIHEIIDRLDIYEKIIFLKLYCQELSIRDAAISCHTSKSQLLRILYKIRKKIWYHLS